MIIRTWTFSTLLLLALNCLIIQRMVGLFFPSVAHVACCSILASLQIVVNHLFIVPVYARNGLICVYWRIPSIILPIMCIYAFLFLMFSKVKYAILCLIDEHIKILIFHVVMYKFSQNLLLAMCICTELLVWTLIDGVGPMCTETPAIHLNMVLFLY